MWIGRRIRASKRACEGRTCTKTHKRAFFFFLALKNRQLNFYEKVFCGKGFGPSQLKSLRSVISYSRPARTTTLSIFRLIRMLILFMFMSPEPVINHHFKPSCYRDSLDISSKGAPKTENELALLVYRDGTLPLTGPKTERLTKGRAD